MGDYRERVYARYASLFQKKEATFDRAGAAQWGKAYDTYLRGWLPQSKSSAIADLACGSGALLYFFYERGYTNLSGVDVSPEQVKLARQIAPQVEEGDVLSFLRNHPGAFDLLTGFDIVEHFSKDEVLDFLDLCLSALKPGGSLILQTPNARSPLVGGVRYGDFTHELCFEEGVLSSLLEMVGFRHTEAREAGPVSSGYSAKSALRSALWKGVRAGMRLINVIETGSPGPQVWTRVFLMRAQK